MFWTKIQGDELQRLQTRLEMPPQSTILEASTLRTPFYHNGELVKMNDGMGVMFMVAAGPGELSAREFYPLTGESSEIRAANKAARLVITQENAGDYLRFFMTFLQTGEGEFFKSPTESPRRLVEGGHPRLSRSGDINEDCNKDEERIAEEAKKAKHKCQGLSDGGGNLRCSGSPEFHGEDRVQDAAAVHRESGDHVEEDQEDVGGGEPSKKRDAWIFDPCQIVGLDRSEDEEEEKGDGDVHHRSCDRDREFLRRLLRHARHARHSPEGSKMTSCASRSQSAAP
jgi:hypothetical protein